VDEVRDAARRILEGDEYDAYAARLGDELNALGGADKAVDLLEELSQEYSRLSTGPRDGNGELSLHLEKA
jgi:UDP:flavonoid glycosyltransferase YjiC (YdhE family)